MIEHIHYHASHIIKYTVSNNIYYKTYIVKQYTLTNITISPYADIVAPKQPAHPPCQRYWWAADDIKHKRPVRCSKNLVTTKLYSINVQIVYIPLVNNSMFHMLQIWPDSYWQDIYRIRLQFVFYRKDSFHP